MQNLYKNKYLLLEYSVIQYIAADRDVDGAPLNFKFSAGKGKILYKVNENCEFEEIYFYELKNGKRLNSEEKSIEISQEALKEKFVSALALFRLKKDPIISETDPIITRLSETSHFSKNFTLLEFDNNDEALLYMELNKEDI